MSESARAGEAARGDDEITIADILSSVVRLWWVWGLTAVFAVLYVGSSQQDWNMPWFPALMAVGLFIYGIRTVRRKAGETKAHRRYGIGGEVDQLEDRKFQCQVCGATFKQPEGADICPECYESGAVRIQ